MFGPVVPTPYDLRFPLLGIPVRVSPWFWLMAVVLGWPYLQLGMPSLLMWVFAVFVSILVHEFGHALTARACGYPPRVLLYQFGGLAMFSPTHNFSLGRSLLITAAGPLAGLALGGVAIVVGLVLAIRNVPLAPGAEIFLTQMVYINIFWSVLNLMPVLPLDGGQIARDLLLMISPRRGMRIALVVSLVVGGLLAAGALYMQMFFLAILFGSMAGGSLTELQQRR